MLVMPVALTHPPDLLKNDWVYGVLRRRIRDLELPPGAPLRKDELSLEFGVSRAPISEAITRLAEEGLVDVFPQHGSFVAEIRAQDVREGLFIRFGLETQAIRLLAINRTPELMAELDANIAAQAAAIDVGDLRRFQDLDEDLHNIIFSAVNYPRVQGFLDSARAQLDRIRPLTLPVEGRPLAALNEHRWMVEALRRRDPEFAAAAVRAHLVTVSEAVEVQLLRLLPSMSRK
jgi:DNA-binding GntR family transcriptional regulator